MSEEPKKPGELDAPDVGEGISDEDSGAMRALLKRSLVAPVEEGGDEAVAADRVLLASVQQKIRKRSRGKFYADGWSTTHSRLNYALVAMIMLVTIAAVYLALGPTGFTR